MKLFFYSAPIALASLAVSGCAAVPKAAIAPDASAAALAQACAGKDGWRDPAPPAKLASDVYFVGTCGITSILITSPAGHVLIDSAEAEAVPQILANIQRLNVNPRDIKWLLASHVHYDHVGGHAAMQQATGAKIAALPEQARELLHGDPMDDDPQHGIIQGIAPVQTDLILTDGAPLRVGPLAITPFATPGHTRGSTSWVIRTCASSACVPVALADSVSPVSAEPYRFVENQAWVEQFRGGVGRIASLPCAILITPHPAASNLFGRLAGDAALADPDACRTYSHYGLDWMDRRLSRERSGS